MCVCECLRVSEQSEWRIIEYAFMEIMDTGIECTLCITVHTSSINYYYYTQQRNTLCIYHVCSMVRQSNYSICKLLEKKKHTN